MSIAAGYFGAKYSKYKRVLKELSEAINETYKVLEDNKITKKELKRLIKEWKDVLDSLEG
jgi:flagellar motility protein MotE (MotC chaperone)